MNRCLSQQGRAAAVMLLLLTWVVQACRKEPPNGELLVFAAASTADAIGDVGREFEAETGQTVRFSFGASRDLARQIRAGAPAAVLISADTETIDALVDAKLVRKEDQRTFASNRLVVIVPQAAAAAIRTPRDLLGVAHLAIGDPKLVPAGSYAQKWLEKEELWTEVVPHVLPSLDVRAALAAVETGHAEAGIVYRTDAAHSQRVRIAYEVPAERSPTIAYVAACLVSTEDAGARRFLDFLAGSKGRATFVRHGFADDDRSR
jgi:molybdate transport system substrate-binding protein